MSQRKGNFGTSERFSKASCSSHFKGLYSDSPGPGAVLTPYLQRNDLPQHAVLSAGSYSAAPSVTGALSAPRPRTVTNVRSDMERLKVRGGSALWGQVGRSAGSLTRQNGRKATQGDGTGQSSEGATCGSETGGGGGRQFATTPGLGDGPGPVSLLNMRR